MAGDVFTGRHMNGEKKKKYAHAAPSNARTSTAIAVCRQAMLRLDRAVRAPWRPGLATGKGKGASAGQGATKKGVSGDGGASGMVAVRPRCHRLHCEEALIEMITSQLPPSVRWRTRKAGYASQW